jgi:hypothetical protein
MIFFEVGYISGHFSLSRKDDTFKVRRRLFVVESILKSRP